MSKLSKGSKKIDKSAKATKSTGKATKAVKTPKSEGSAVTRERISQHMPAVEKALASSGGATVEGLRESLGICRKSVRKLLANAGAVRGEDKVYRAK